MNFSQQSPAPPPPPSYADPIEQRDSWRIAWGFLTSDVVLAVLGAWVGLMMLLAYLLPQVPAAGTDDVYAYSLWQTQAQSQTGALYEMLLGLGLFGVFQQAWVRLLMALLAAVTFLRLFDAIARLRLANLAAEVLRDELRVRVTNQAPSIESLAARLQQMRYHVVASPDALHANRTPLAEFFSIALHAGVLLMLFGALLNGLLGWRINNRSLISNTPTPLVGNQTLSLLENDAGQGAARVQLAPANIQTVLSPQHTVALNGIALLLRESTPGVRASATRNSQPLMLTISNYAPPATEAQLTFLPDERERFFFVPQASWVVQISLPVAAASIQDAQVAVRNVPTGTLIAQGALTASVVISGSDVVLSFMPSSGAIIDASYQPGNGPLWIGLGLALLGGLGTLLYPTQRIVVRNHVAGNWTEFYASGRGVRNVISKMLS